MENKYNYTNNKHKMEKTKTIEKRKNPKFIRQCAHKKRRISRTGWRKPKGGDSKMRLCKKGHRKMVSSGFGNPKSLRGLTKKGYKEVLVSNLLDLKDISLNYPERCVILISSSVGNKKKIEIIKEAIKLPKIANKEKLEQRMKKIQEEFEKRREEKKKKVEEKTKKEKELEKKAKEKEEKEKEDKKEEKTEDEKKAEEKEEKDKTLIKAK